MKRKALIDLTQNSNLRFDDKIMIKMRRHLRKARMARRRREPKRRASRLKWSSSRRAPPTTVVKKLGIIRNWEELQLQLSKTKDCVWLCSHLKKNQTIRLDLSTLSGTGSPCHPATWMCEIKTLWEPLDELLTNNRTCSSSFIPDNTDAKHEKSSRPNLRSQKLTSNHPKSFLQVPPNFYQSKTNLQASKLC